MPETTADYKTCSQPPRLADAVNGSGWFYQGAEVLIEGAVDVARLRTCLIETAIGHEFFRSFAAGKNLVQWKQDDLSLFDENERGVELAALLAGELASDGMPVFAP